MSSIISVNDLCLWYGQTQALKNINMEIPEKSITALIGPSGCGKSTFLKTLDRMNDLVPGVKITGEVKYKDQDIYAPGTDVNELRRCGRCWISKRRTRRRYACWRTRRRSAPWGSPVCSRRPLTSL